MNTALASMIVSAAGTGAPTLPSSRYYGSPTLTLTLPDGTQVNYLQRRRIMPQASIYQTTQSYVVVRRAIGSTTSPRKFLGDPLLFWMICDANGADDPDDLTAQVGRSIQIPLASGIPTGARSG